MSEGSSAQNTGATYSGSGHLPAVTGEALFGGHQAAGQTDEERSMGGGGGRKRRTRNNNQMEHNKVAQQKYRLVTHLDGRHPVLCEGM